MNNKTTIELITQNSYDRRHEQSTIPQHEAPEEHWKMLITLRKNYNFKEIKQEDLLLSKFITSNTNKITRKTTTPKN